MHSKESALDAAIAFVNAVRAGGIAVSKAYVFGSWVRGTATQDSDIDVALVSPEFTRFRFDDLGKIARFKIRASTDLEVHPFPEQQFTPDNPLVREIVNSGLQVA